MFCNSQTSIFRPRQRKLVLVFCPCIKLIKTKHKIDGNMIVSPSIALPATRPSIRSPAAGSQKGRWETISGVSKYRWQITSGVCNGRCSKKSIRKGKLRSNHGLRLLWQCRTCDGIQGLPKLLHGMRRARTQAQDERVSEPSLYQVPGLFWKAYLSIKQPLTAHDPIHPRVSSRHDR